MSAEQPMLSQLYVVQRIGWRDDKEGIEPFSDTPLKAFTTRPAAEAYREELAEASRTPPTNAVEIQRIWEEKEIIRGLLHPWTSDLRFFEVGTVTAEGPAASPVYLIRFHGRLRWYSLMPRPDLQRPFLHACSMRQTAEDWLATNYPPPHQNPFNTVFPRWGQKAFLRLEEDRGWVISYSQIEAVFAGGPVDPPLPLPDYQAHTMWAGWWLKNRNILTVTQRTKIWQLLCPMPYEIVPVELAV